LTKTICVAIFYTDKELDKIYGIDFHREVKPFIIKDARLFGFLKKLRASNPDVGLEDDIIFLRDPRNHKLIVKTTFDINLYI